MRMVHRTEIVGLDLVEGGDGDVAEFEVPRGARVLKGPLKKLKIPSGAIVGSVVRGEQLGLWLASDRLRNGSASPAVLALEQWCNH